MGRTSHIIPPSTALISELACPSFSSSGVLVPSTLFSSAGLRRDRFSFATLQSCKTCSFAPALVGAPNVWSVSLQGLEPKPINWSLLLSISAIRALALAPTEPLTPRQRPGAGLIATECEAHSQTLYTLTLLRHPLVRLKTKA